MAKCPICDEECDEKSDPSTVYKDEKYYFCCEGCKKAFERHPEKYLAEKA